MINSDSWQIKLLYDGECPLCVREVNFLQKRDAGRGLVAFVDIAAVDYDPTEHAGIDFAAAMGRIHAIQADGTVLRNMAVFRQVYAVLGMGWIYAVTDWPVIGPVVDWLYDRWADYRLALTGRESLAAVIQAREARLAERERDRCRI